ncbi:hypothetical protein Syun_013349 [Stephania yunnanensis]|uniref:WRKY domain-containing protein n=1 Tax=Stephania yunnanensis TaxID=152371 RepID=A0AAP0PII3_9MAGN
MEISCMDWERKPLINELTQGKLLVNQLRFHLNNSSSSSSSNGEMIIEQILASFNKALMMLTNCGNTRDSSPLRASTPPLPLPPPPLVPMSGMSESPRSAIESPGSDDYDRRDMFKKRKTLPRWTEQVRVCSGTGLEGPLEDGYSWRKYGQKDILGAKYPRGYYRCTHRNVQGCLATKQVQRSDEDPSVFDVTYRGRHTCVQASHIISTSQSANDKAEVQGNHNKQEQEKPKQAQEILLNFKTGLKVKTEDLDGTEFTPSSFSFPSTPIEYTKTENHIFSSLSLDNNFMGSFSPSFVSPTTSGSNYFSPCRMNNIAPNFQTCDSDHAEIISAATSCTNSPILDIHFSLDSLEFDPNFPFDSSGFFN